MDVRIAHMDVLPFGTYFWEHRNHSRTDVPLCEITDGDPFRLEAPGTAPQYGIGMAYNGGVCWILWAFDEEDVPTVLSHEFMHCLLEKIESSWTSARMERISDKIGLGRSILP